MSSPSRNLTGFNKSRWSIKNVLGSPKCVTIHLKKEKQPIIHPSKCYRKKILQKIVSQAKVFIFTGLRTRRPYFSLLAKKKKIYIFPKLSTSSGIFLTEQVLCFRIHLNHQSAYNNEDFSMISSF